MAKDLTKIEIITLLKEVISDIKHKDLKEDWNNKILYLQQELDTYETHSVKEPEKKIKKEPVNPTPDLAAKGLKIRHKKTDILYTVDTIGKNVFALKNPEGKIVYIKADELKQYKLD